MNYPYSSVNTRCLRKACEKLNIPCCVLDDFGNFIEVNISLKNSKYFINAKTPFNSDSESFLMKDKDFTYRTFGKTFNMPKTKGYLNPNTDKNNQKYLEFKTIKEIIKDIESSFSYPVIIKMNSGSRGHNIFLCKNKTKIIRALKTIYSKKSRYFDYIAIAQDYIEIKKEYRVIWFKDSILLIYEKELSQSKQKNLSPLHNEGAKAILVKDKDFISSITDFVKSGFKNKNVEFAGLDIVIDNKGEKRLLEMNSYPGFSYFVRDNGDRPLVEVYEKILKSF